MRSNREACSYTSAIEPTSLTVVVGNAFKVIDTNIARALFPLGVIGENIAVIIEKQSR